MPEYSSKRGRGGRTERGGPRLSAWVLAVFYFGLGLGLSGIVKQVIIDGFTLTCSLAALCAVGFIKWQNPKTQTTHGQRLFVAWGTLRSVANVVAVMDSPTPPIVIDDSNGSAMDACFTAFDKDGCVWKQNESNTKFMIKLCIILKHLKYKN